MSYLLIAVVGAPLLGALLAGLHRGMWAIAATALAGVAAIGLTAGVVDDGPVAATIGEPAVVGLVADRTVVAILLLVLGVSAVVQGYARRYLHGHEESTWFCASAGALTSATAAFTASATLVSAAVAWTAAGVALLGLLATFRHLPAARLGVSRTARRIAIGDLALWAAVVVATVAWGSVQLDGIGDDVAGQAVTPVALLLVVAAASRCALVPFHAWLPATLAAPTPVSALLHAGVVNAGGILLLRTSGIFGASPAAMHLAFALGALTVVAGAAMMLVRTDVKGALVHSTVAQMGFMVMTLGLGGAAAALFHLLAHGMYKAALFLASGTAVHRRVRHAGAPPLAPRRRTLAPVAIAGLTAAVALAVGAALVHPPAGASGALLGFAWATATWAGWALLRRHRGVRAGAAVVAAVTGSVLSYLVLLHAFSSFFAPGTPDAGAAASAWLVVPVAAALVALWLIRNPLPGTTRLSGGARAAYVTALSAGHVRPALPGRGSRRPTSEQPVVLAAIGEQP